MKNNLILSEIPKSPLLQNLLAESSANYGLWQARNQEVTLFPVTAIHRNVEPATVRRYELPEEFDGEERHPANSYRQGAVSMPPKTSWSDEQPGPMWASQVCKESDTPGPSCSSKSFFEDSFFADENNTAFNTSNTIAAYSGRDGPIQLNGNREVDDLEDDPNRILESFLNSGTGPEEDAWLAPLSNTVTDFPPLVSPIEANVIPAEFNFEGDPFTSFRAEGNHSSSPENPSREPMGSSSSIESTAMPDREFTSSYVLDSSPMSSHRSSEDDREDNFSLSELDQFLPPPTKQPKYTVTGSPSGGAAGQRVQTELPTVSVRDQDRYLMQGSPPDSSAQEGFTVTSNQDGSRTVNIADAVKIRIPRDFFVGVTLDRDKLIDMPIDDFNLLLQKSPLGDSGVAYMKEWRRKGKNKKAAKIARKRKRDEMGDLEVEVDDLKQKVSSCLGEKAAVLRELQKMKAKAEALEAELLAMYSNEQGTNFSRKTHHLLLSSQLNGLFMVPRLAAATK